MYQQSIAVVLPACVMHPVHAWSLLSHVPCDAELLVPYTVTAANKQVSVALQPYRLQALCIISSSGQFLNKQTPSDRQYGI